MSLAWPHRQKSLHYHLASLFRFGNHDMTVVATGSVKHWMASSVAHVEVCVGHRTFRMDATMSSWNVMGFRPQSEGLYCPPLVYVQCLLPWTNSGSHEPNQGLYRNPPPPPNPQPCTQDPHEVIQVGVMSLPWRNDLHP